MREKKGWGRHEFWTTSGRMWDARSSFMHSVYSSALLQFVRIFCLPFVSSQLSSRRASDPSRIRSHKALEDFITYSSSSSFDLATLVVARAYPLFAHQVLFSQNLVIFRWSNLYSYPHQQHLIEKRKTFHGQGSIYCRHMSLVRGTANFPWNLSIHLLW